MRVFNLLFCLFAFSNAVSGKENRQTAHFNRTQLGRMFLESNVHGVRIELKKLLDGPVSDFITIINSTTADGKNIFSMRYDNTELENEKTQLRKILLSPLKQLNQNAWTARELARTNHNKPVFDMMAKYDSLKLKDEFFEIPEDSSWSAIPQIPLETSLIAQAISNEDIPAFWEALEKLKTGPTKTLLAVWHGKTTEEQDTPWHLAAKVSQHQEEFARGLEELMNFVLPHSITHPAKNKAKIKRAMDNIHQSLNIAVTLTIAPMSIELLVKGAFMEAAIAEAIGLITFSQCSKAFESKNLSPPKDPPP